MDEWVNATKAIAGMDMLASILHLSSVEIQGFPNFYFEPAVWNWFNQLFCGCRRYS